MHNNIVDTNIIVSALIQRSYPYRVMYDLFLENKFCMCASDAILQEYYDVLLRPKFSQYPDFYAKAEMMLGCIGSRAKIFTPYTKVDMLTDKGDNKFLELAEECSADFIITGNVNDFTFPAYRDTRIITAKAYWEMFL